MSDEATYGEKPSPYAKALMKAMGGDPRAMTLTATQVKRWGYDRPESVLHLVEDPELVDMIVRIPDQTLKKTERELIDQLPPGRPSPVDRRFRLAFWEEYEAAAQKLKPMSLEKLAAGTGSLSWSLYREQLMESPELMAWFFKPPASYTLAMKEVHDMGLERLRDIMSLPLTDPSNGKINPAVGALILQAYKLIDLRVNGAVTQKVINMNMGGGEVPKDATSMDVKSVDAEIARLEALLAGKEAPRISAQPAEEPRPPAQEPVLLPKEGS